MGSRTSRTMLAGFLELITEVGGLGWKFESGKLDGYWLSV